MDDPQITWLVVPKSKSAGNKDGVQGRKWIVDKTESGCKFGYFQFREYGPYCMGRKDSMLSAFRMSSAATKVINILFSCRDLFLTSDLAASNSIGGHAIDYTHWF